MRTLDNRLTKAHNRGIMGYTKKCTVCSATFTHQSAQALTCSYDCRKKREADRYRKHNPPQLVPLSTGTVGALSELKAAVNLLAKGYEVFRAMSPAASCDLAILRNGTVLRIEVKTGHKSTYSGAVVWPKISRERFDVLALVLSDEILYDPPLSLP